jgi:hypothetical protein
MPDTIEEPLIETSIRACTTLDAPSLAVLEKITEKLGVSSRQRAAKQILGDLMTEETDLEDVIAFRKEYWDTMVRPDSGFEKVRFDWTGDENSVLHFVAKRLFGNQNRSKALRVLIAHYALKHKYAKLLKQGYILQPAD